MDKDAVIRESVKYYSYVTNTYELKKDQTYKLYATGDADLNGRKYVALSKPPTPEEIKKYNLLE